MIAIIVTAAALGSLQLLKGVAANPLEIDFPPKLIHQPPNVQVPANKPHNFECPVEARPEAEVRWFKDNQLLESQPSHNEQTGKELMFFQINDDDSGAYHCEATNPLGTVTSDQFRLTVLSSVYDAAIRFEPRQAAVGIDQQVEFRCIIPLTLEQQQLYSSGRSLAPEVDSSNEDDNDGANFAPSTPNVSWRRDGKRLPVRWTSSSSLSSTGSGSTSQDVDVSSGGANNVPRFVARQNAPNEFILSVTRTLASDDNTTFTCLYEPSPVAGSSSNSFDASALSPSSSKSEILARESSQVRLYVIKNNNNNKQDLGKQVSMAPAIENLPEQKAPNELNPSPNRTTSILQPTGDTQPTGPRKVITLSETLRDLYELIKPTLMVFGVILVVCVVIVMQFLILRRRAQQNRYMKHHQQYNHSSTTSNASSSTSSTSAAGVGFVGLRNDTNGVVPAYAHCDPVLTSLLNRTLSAPSSVSLTGTGKKYKSYRDHLRKVSAVGSNTNTSHLVANELIRNDFIYAPNYFATTTSQHHRFNSTLNPSTHTSDVHDPFYNALNPQQAQLPNLYNQSLAAREQARSLLQSNNDSHMRSLSNHTYEILE